MKASVSVPVSLEPKTPVSVLISKIEEESLNEGADVITVRAMVTLLECQSEQYANALLISPCEVVQSLELQRSIAPHLFYTEINIPDINGCYLFHTRSEFLNCINSGKFICFKCGSTGKSPYLCNAVVKSELHPGGRICGCKSGNGIYASERDTRIVIRSEFLSTLIVHQMFMPAGFKKLSPYQDDDYI